MLLNPEINVDFFCIERRTKRYCVIRLAKKYAFLLGM